MQSFKSHIKEYTDSPLTLGQISSQHSAGLKVLKKFGSKPMAIMGTAGQDYIIGTLSNYDKKEYRSLKKPSGTEIYRYVTPSSSISGQIPIVAVNLDKGHMYFMTPESAEADKPEFEKKIGFRAKYVRELTGPGVSENYENKLRSYVAKNATKKKMSVKDQMKAQTAKDFLAMRDKKNGTKKKVKEEVELEEAAYHANIEHDDYQKIRQASMRGNFGHKFTRKTNGDVTFSTQSPNKLAADLEKLIDSGASSWKEILGIKEEVALDEVLDTPERKISYVNKAVRSGLKADLTTVNALPFTKKAKNAKQTVKKRKSGLARFNRLNQKEEYVEEEVAANATASVGVSANDVKNIGYKKRKPSVLTRHYIEVMGKRKKLVK